MSKIAYDLSLIKGIVFDIDGVLSPSTVPLGKDGMPERMANVKDGFSMHIALKHGLNLAIISGGIGESIDNRFRLIGMEDVYLGVSDKLPVLKEWMNIKGLTPEEVAFVGDDLPDIPCLNYVGLSCCPSDAAEDVKQVALYISKLQGGYGIGREIIEEVMKAHGKWMSSSNFLTW